MAVEIERKFLVPAGQWNPGAQVGTRLLQGYLCRGDRASVRVRLAADQAWLTVKGPTTGISRAEFEYAIPVDDANAMLAELAGGRIVEKIRYAETFAGHLWSVDRFLGDNAGLIVAEIELDHPEAVVPLPPWVGPEVSGDSRYFNSSLAVAPFSTW
jgi:adenylate cyclase